MSTAPFSPAVAALITGPHEAIVSAVATVAGLDPIHLEVVGGRIGWSERRSPRVAASLEVNLPDAALVEALDPRTAVRVAVSVTYTLPSGAADTHEVADLHLRAREVNRPRSLLILDLASDEALVIEASVDVNADAPPWTAPSGPAGIKTLIEDTLYGTPAYPPTVVVTYTSSEPAQMSSGDSWDSISETADQLDADVYDNGDRVFRVAPRPAVASTSVLTLKTGAGGTVIESSSSVSRDDWANFVTIRYDYEEAGVRTSTYGTAKVLTGPYAVTNSGRRYYFETRDRKVSQAAANAAALSLLRRMLSRSRSLTLTAVPAWWLRPGHTITVQLPTSTQRRDLVAEVEFDLERATMSVTTRLPDTAHTLGE